MLGLEPPGNLGRELALYRRSLFAAGCFAGAALAFPELSALAFAALPPRGERGLWSSAGARIRALASCWEGVEGGFAAAGLFASEGRIYAGLEGPWPLLAAAAGEACARLGLEASGAPAPYPLKSGFFLCEAPGMRLEDLPKPPALSFRDASLVVLRLRWRGGPDGAPIAAATWTELGRARRRTGPGERPSQRRPRG